MSCRWRMNWVCACTLLWLVGFASACTKSHDTLRADDSDSSVDEGSEAGRGGRGVAGGSGGRGGAGSDAGEAGQAAAPGGDCGACPEPEGIGVFLGAASCCTESNTCGLTLAALGVAACFELDAPGTETADCPSAMLGQGFTLPGCCTPDGICGALDEFLGLGCAVFAGAQVVSCDP
jgi:hypothetical protein